MKKHQARIITYLQYHRSRIKMFLIYSLACSIGSIIYYAAATLVDPTHTSLLSLLKHILIGLIASAHFAFLIGPLLHLNQPRDHNQ